MANTIAKIKTKIFWLEMAIIGIGTAALISAGALLIMLVKYGNYGVYLSTQLQNHYRVF